MSCSGSSHQTQKKAESREPDQDAGDILRFSAAGEDGLEDGAAARIVWRERKGAS